jgi:urease accessory protein
MTATIDRRSAAEIGRHARLELVFAVKDGRTVLAHAYAEPPLRAGRCFAEGDGLHMIMASTAPGIFGGDAVDQAIIVEPGARVRLSSQSSLQLHPGVDHPRARVRSTFRVGRDARLSCHWHPLIPFAGASLDQQITIEVADSSELYWSDAIMSGRHARGEHWAFLSVAHELKLSRGGELAYVERFDIAGVAGRADGRWTASGAAYFGTTAVSRRGLGDRVREDLQAGLAEIDGIRAAADAPDESLVIVRLMSAHGVPFHAARALVDRTFC